MSRPYKSSRGPPSQLKDMAKIEMADENLMKIQMIREVISMEEGVESSVDEALTRILEFYRKFVPYN